jgi:hypothetical protein
MSPITFDYRHKSSLLDCDLFFLADSVISVVYMIMLIPDKSNKLSLYTFFISFVENVIAGLSRPLHHTSNTCNCGSLILHICLGDPSVLLLFSCLLVNINPTVQTQNMYL